MDRKIIWCNYFLFLFRLLSIFSLPSIVSCRLTTRVVNSLEFHGKLFDLKHNRELNQSKSRKYFWHASEWTAKLLWWHKRPHQICGRSYSQYDSQQSAESKWDTKFMPIIGHWCGATDNFLALFRNEAESLFGREEAQTKARD